MSRMDEFHEALATVMLLGAARLDATPQQQLLLGERVEAIKLLVADGRWADARELVREVMDADWVPNPSYDVRRD